MDALATVTYAGTKKSLVESEMVADQPAVAQREDGSWKVTVVLEFPRETDPFLKSTVKSAEAAIKYQCKKAAEESGDEIAGHSDIPVEVEIVTEFKSKPRPKGDELLNGVKNIIAVSSGKGGVGKSTVSANLAIALARLGYKVGLLDCDIFGPSMPKMFHVEDERPYAVEKDGRQLICPIEAYGVKMLSIGFFVSPDTATLWRGGMATSALKQLIADADWGELDYFILDTPPGTSDIHLTLLQTLAITGAVIVSTPQQVALADARKGIDMYRNEKVNVPILGLIENMAWFTPAETTSSARRAASNWPRRCRFPYSPRFRWFRASATAATKASLPRSAAIRPPVWPSSIWPRPWSPSSTAATRSSPQPRLWV